MHGRKVVDLMVHPTKGQAWQSEVHLQTTFVDKVDVCFGGPERRPYFRGIGVDLIFFYFISIEVIIAVAVGSIANRFGACTHFKGIGAGHHIAHGLKNFILIGRLIIVTPGVDEQVAKGVKVECQ